MGILNKHSDFEHGFGRPDEASAAGETGFEIVSTLLDGYQGRVAVRLWDGRTHNDQPDTTCTLQFMHPGILRDLVLKRDLVRLGEAYLSGGQKVEGNMESLFELGPWLQRLRLSASSKLRLLYLALRLPSGLDRDAALERRAGSTAIKRNSQKSIAHHYDVSNDFYRLWLDPQMIYSCAYFRDERQSLSEAQCDKLDHICRKLRLQPGQTLLDIGCGWGALVIWAAKNYGVQSHGITLSKQQFQYAQRRITAEGLTDRVVVELRDYRDLYDESRYDRIVSVGMFEHVGIRNFPRYFGKVKHLLKPGGLFLNHGITNDSGWNDTSLQQFVNKYVFPDGELTRISEVNQAMEQSGFELLDVESLRRHYAYTLRQWVRSLEAHREEAVTLSSDATYRLWRLYMAGSAYYFDEGSVNVYQVLAGHTGQALSVPLRRDDLYS